MKPSDVRPWLWPAAAAGIFASLAALGKTVFWGDLTYIHFPWRALAAQELMRGRLPLWDPYVYLGMPLAAQMQGAVWYPGTLPFHLFGFETGLAFYHAAHYGLASLLAHLWLRRLRLPATAALGGAATYAACGVMISRVPFLNHRSTLALLPALLLFAEEPWLLGLAAALAFLSGYPLMLAGGAAAAFIFSRLTGGRARPAVWSLAVVFAAGLGAVLLIPAARLAAGSHRGAGMPMEEILGFALEPADLGGVLLPWLSSAGLDAATQWWRTWWFGLAASAAAAAGLARMKPRLRWPLVAYGASVVLVSLGGSNPASLWLWTHVALLRLVRYPGNMTYLLLPAVALAAGAGLAGRRRAGAWAALIAVELLVYAVRSQPVVPGGFFTDAGPLARTLQRDLGDSRYLLSPRALEWTRGAGPDPAAAALDLKHRFYGLTNVPYRLAAASGFGEPLVPRPNYGVMDFLYTRHGVPAVAPYLPWAGVRTLLTRERYPEGGLRYLGVDLWHAYRSEASAAFWLSPDEAERVPAELTAELPQTSSSRPVALVREPGRVEVSGRTAAGWVYVSEPRYPGWQARLDGQAVEAKPAWGAFEMFPVPEGRWRLSLRYRPEDFLVGALITALAVSASAAYWYNRVRSC